MTGHFNPWSGFWLYLPSTCFMYSVVLTAVYIFTILLFGDVTSKTSKKAGVSSANEMHWEEWNVAFTTLQWSNVDSQQWTVELLYGRSEFKSCYPHRYFYTNMRWAKALQICFEGKFSKNGKASSIFERFDELYFERRVFLGFQFYERLPGSYIEYSGTCLGLGYRKCKKVPLFYSEKLNVILFTFFFFAFLEK